MTGALSEQIVIAGLLFCRIGACLMLIPGISGDRIAPHIRLFLAFSIVMALFPMQAKSISEANTESAAGLALLIVAECAAGFVLGFLVRILYLALEFAAVTMANCAGYGSIFMQAIDENHSTGPFSEIISLTAVALFFTMDLHVAVVIMLQNSYSTIPPGGLLNGPFDLLQLGAGLHNAFLLSLQLSAPLIIFSLTVNLAFGLLNKLVPQVPAYFLSVPFAMAGGLIILLRSDGAILRIFISAVGETIQRIAGLG